MYEHDFKAFPELSNSELEIFQFFSPHPQIVDDFVAEVVKVHDGDTVTLSVSFRDFNFPLRFANVDAPELSEGGDVARDWLSDKIVGEEVMVLVDFDNRVGKYGRLIGTVIFRGMNIAEEMLHLGLVSEFGKKNEGVIRDQDYYFGRGLESGA